MSVARTVLGDVPPDVLGVTYCHEHLIIDSPLIVDRFPHIHLPSVDDAVAEARTCADSGVRTMVDAMPCAAGRDVVKLTAVARRTGINVVAATGLHTARYYDGLAWTRAEPADVLADLFCADIDDGIDRYDYRGPVVRRTTHRAGVVKAATLGEHPDQRERILFEAVAQAHARTGAPVITHCEGGGGAVGQIELFRDLRVSLGRVVLSHTDKRLDLGYHREILSSGVNVEYDQVLRHPVDGEPGAAWLITEMLSEGFGDQLMLGTDGARRSLWLTLGGSPGLAWLYARFSDILARRGVDEDGLHRLFVANPARWLAFAPASG